MNAIKNHISVIDLCLNLPCIFGTCSPYPGGYTCDCLQDYKGKNCDEGMLTVLSCKIMIDELYNDTLFYYWVMTIGIRAHNKHVSHYILSVILCVFLTVTFQTEIALIKIQN